MAQKIENTPRQFGTVRQLRPSEEALFRDHLLALSPSSRRDRFNGVIDDDFLRDYAARCFHNGATVIGFFVDDQLRGVAELHERLELDEPTGEIAFSVQEDFQHLGIGGQLFARLIEAARGLGYRHLQVTTHSQNEAMKRLARRFDAHLTFSHGDTVGRIDLAPLDRVALLPAGAARAEVRNNG